MFSLQQNCRTQRWNRFSLEGGGWEGAQTMYSHVSKCKNGKIKEEKKKPTKQQHKVRRGSYT
jgi:hypothetical protein